MNDEHGVWVLDRGTDQYGKPWQELIEVSRVAGEVFREPRVIRESNGLRIDYEDGTQRYIPYTSLREYTYKPLGEVGV